MSNRLIDIVDITKSYGDSVILDQLNLYIRENEFFPSKMIFPESGVSKPPKILSSVVFPHPLGPSKVKNSFSRI